MYSCASRKPHNASLEVCVICIAMASLKIHCLLLLMQLLHILCVSSLCTRVFLCVSLVNHVTDEEAKARATAGKCRDIIIILIV